MLERKVYNNDTFAKPSCDNVLQPSPLRGSGCNTLSHSGLANVNIRKRMFYPLNDESEQDLLPLFMLNNGFHLLKHQIMICNPKLTSQQLIRDIIKFDLTLASMTFRRKAFGRMRQTSNSASRRTRPFVEITSKDNLSNVQLSKFLRKLVEK